MHTKSIVATVSCFLLVVVSGCIGESSEGEVQEILDNLLQAGFPVSDVQVVNGKVYVGNDAEVSLAASREMLHGPSGEEQFRTTNLVATRGTPTNICVNGAAFTDTVLSTALDRALENYNKLFDDIIIVIWIHRVTGGAVPGCHYFINGVVVPGLVGGQSGFPAGGAPFGTINIGDGIVQFGVDVATHVITHELGHTIGLRHSDFFNRSISCGTGGNEGDGGVGAILIPGTPSVATVGGSIMNSCFRSTETGKFTPSDIVALDSLY